MTRLCVKYIAFSNSILFFRFRKKRTMSAQKRKRTEFTLNEKKEIIDAAKKEPNQCKLAKEMSKKWGVEVKRTTVKGILSKKDAIEAAINAGVSSKRKKLTQAHAPKLDDGLLMWLKQARGQNLPVSGDLLKEKAMKLAELMHITDFTASEGWLDKFKKRHGITFKTVQGEAGAVDSQSLLEWQQQVLQPLLRQFSADDVFNLDETGLFWQLLPNKTMTFRGQRCTGGKKSKQRITLLVGANMSGSEKLPLLAIGNSKRPRAFKNKEIPVKYEANSKAWMTAELFEETLRAFDGRLGQQGRRVLLCLDNFSGHPPDLQLENIQLIFFPPTTTANSQPMNQGIIENLKRHYKKLLLRRRLEAMDEGKEFKFTLLDALHVARRAWEQVSESTIRNCFAKAKFNEEEIQTEPEDVELLEIWEALPAGEKMHDKEEIELSEFLEADERLATSGSFTLEEIAEEMLRSEEPVESEDDEVTVEEEIVPFEEAQRAWSTVRKFMQQRSGKPGVMQACDRLDNEMHEIRQKKMRQPTILESFGLN